MRRHLNSLFVTTQGAYLRRRGPAVEVRVDNKTQLRVPIHLLESIVCFGRIACSPALLGLCGERGVLLSFLSIHGRFLARVQGPVNGNVLLRREQYRRSDDPAATREIGRTLVTAKLLNARTILERRKRDLKESDADHTRLAKGSRELKALLARVESVDGLEALRGLEGLAARSYFACFESLITADRKTFPFSKRSKRPPRDPVNALMSFLYTLLTSDVISAIETVGLDPAVGYLHRDRPGRAGLALDLVEELRSAHADRLVLALINRKQIKLKDFVAEEGGAVRLVDDARKRVIEAYQTRKAQEIQHPFLEEKTTIGMIPHLQARLFARYLRGDLDAYPPFLVR